MPTFNTDNQVEKRPFYLRWWALLPTCLLVLLLVVVGAMYWHNSRQVATYRKLIAEVDALWLAGEPVDNESLQELYLSATSDTYSDDWVALGKRVTEGELQYRLAELYQSPDNPAVEVVYPVPPSGTPWNNRQAVDKFLDEWKDVLARMLELLDLQRQEGIPLYRPVFFDSHDTEVPESHNAQMLMNLLELRHRVAVYDQEHDLAFQLIRAGQTMEQTFYADPVLVNQLVRISINARTLRMIRHSLENNGLSDDQMQQIADELVSFARSHELFVLSLRGERALTLPLFTDPHFAAEALDLEPKLSDGFVVSRGTDGLYYLEQLQAAIDLPSDDPRELADSANQWDEKLSKDAKKHGKLWNFQRMLTQLLLPAISAYASATVRQTEHNRLAQLAMAVRRFEHEHHRWPESLDELLATKTELQSLRAANDEAFGFRLEPSGEAVIWGIYDSLSNPIPAEPPRTDRVQDEDNVEWVWRLQPSPTSSAVVPLP